MARGLEVSTGGRGLADARARRRRRGDRGAIDELITSVLTAKIDREIAAAPASLAEFGLDAPTAEVTLTLKDGRRLGVQLGGKNPTGVWVYGREEGKAAVVALPDSVLRDASRPVADYRDKTVLTFDRSAVTGLDITDPRRDPGARRGRREVEVDAPGRPPRRRRRRRRFPGEARRGAREGVRGRGARVRFRATGSIAPFGWISRPDATRTGLRRLCSSGGSIPPSRACTPCGRGSRVCFFFLRTCGRRCPRAWPRSATRPWSPSIATRSPRSRSTAPRGPVTLARENNQWRIIVPEAWPPIRSKPGSAPELRELKAQAFLTEDASGIPCYLAKPALRVTVTLEGGGATTLLLGPSPERRGNQPSAYAAVAGSGRWCWSTRRPSTISVALLNDFRDRRLLGEVEPKDVQRVTVNAVPQDARSWNATGRASGASWSRARVPPRAPESTISCTRRARSMEGHRGPAGGGCPPATASTRRARDHLGAR